MKIRIAIILWSALGGLGMAQENRIDGLRPDAPALAAPGEMAVGVRTITVTHPDRPDVLGAPGARQDRPLTLEVWYPADLKGAAPGGDARDYYDLRAYRLKPGTSHDLLDGYLGKALIPALNKRGIAAVGVFTEVTVDKAAGTSKPLADTPVLLRLVSVRLAVTTISSSKMSWAKATWGSAATRANSEI